MEVCVSVRACACVFVCLIGSKGIVHYGFNLIENIYIKKKSFPSIYNKMIKKYKYLEQTDTNTTENQETIIENTQRGKHKDN